MANAIANGTADEDHYDGTGEYGPVYRLLFEQCIWRAGGRSWWRKWGGGGGGGGWGGSINVKKCTGEEVLIHAD